MKNSGLKLLIATALLIHCEKNPEQSNLKPHLWDVSTPAAQRMNRQLLDSAFVQAGAEGFIDGLLIIRNGYIVAQKYYNGYNDLRSHNTMSVSKSFLSALTGIALQQGYIDSLEEKILDYFPEYIYPDIDPRKYNITIRHLLTMRMGIIGEAENDYGAYWELYNSENWIKTTLTSPLLDDPGVKMRYNTFQTHLLSAIITKATQTSTLEYGNKVLFNPLKITVDSWERDPQGYYFGGTSMYFTPQEMAMLGYLYLNEGNLNGVQIVPRDWVTLTLSPSTNLNHPNEWGTYKNYDYAYLWWLGEINGWKLFMGYGYGGQFVVVFPELNLIVVSTAKPEVDPDTSTIQEWAIFDIISKYILSAIQE